MIKIVKNFVIDITVYKNDKIFFKSNIEVSIRNILFYNIYRNFTTASYTEKLFEMKKISCQISLQLFLIKAQIKLHVLFIYIFIPRKSTYAIVITFFFIHLESTF